MSGRMLFIPAFLILTLMVGCSGKYKTDKHELVTGSAWPYHRGNLSSPGALPDADFGGKLDIVWQHQSNDKPAGPLTIHQGQLIYPGAKNKIRFLQLETGKYSGHIKPKGYVQSGLVAKDSLGFFATGPRKNLLKCVNLRKGKKIWDRYILDVASGMLLVDDMLIVGAGEGVLTALDVESGEEVWSFTAESRFHIPPAYSNGFIFQPGDDGTIYALNPRDGSEVFRSELDGPLVSPVAIDDLVYVADMDGNVYALDKSNGERIWQQTLDGPVWTSPAVSEGTLFVGHSGGELVALDALTGDIVWKYSTVDVIRASALVAGQYVIVGTLTGKLYSLDVDDGSLVDQRELKGAISASPLSDGSRVYVATDRGLITCFGLVPDGE
ncbi:MAG: PQQ-binding-like beta-propeller repeat protein [Candidatus Zixiibacteriota bacterium]|nr:MAG: PQQ-binding-like beta-propeller repeat protein [candidate division Zixibacteria bacterium]